VFKLYRLPSYQIPQGPKAKENIRTSAMFLFFTFNKNVILKTLLFCPVAQQGSAHVISGSQGKWL
jgi:hypothetical protein